MFMKKVTQIVSFYNEEKYIKECIDSLLNQTYSNLELIFVNDGSTDKSLEIVESYNDDRIIIINNTQNRGQAYCRNLGLDIATGEYIGFFDADDISYSNRIELLADYLDEHDDCTCVSGRPKLVDEKLNPIFLPKKRIPLDDIEIKPEMLFVCNVACSCAIFRSIIIKDKHVRQNDKYRISQDYHFWFQFLPEGKFNNIDEYLFEYRTYLSKSRTFEKQNKELYSAWMSEIFMFGWSKYGIDINADEGKYIFEHLHRNKVVWKSKDISMGKELFLKIKESGLDEEIKKRACRIFRKRYLSSFFVCYYLRLIPNEIALLFRVFMTKVWG